MPERDFGRAWGWLISLLMFVAVAVPGWFALVHVRAARTPTPAPPPLTSTECAPPAQRGDKTVIVLAHLGDRITVRCTPLTNPTQPERALQ
jgi:hypothetical protein